MAVANFQSSSKGMKNTLIDNNILSLTGLLHVI